MKLSQAKIEENNSEMSQFVEMCFGSKFSNEWQTETDAHQSTAQGAGNGIVSKRVDIALPADLCFAYLWLFIFWLNSLLFYQMQTFSILKYRFSIIPGCEGLNATIHARYSDDSQLEESIESQISKRESKHWLRKKRILENRWTRQKFNVYLILHQL